MKNFSILMLGGLALFIYNNFVTPELEPVPVADKKLLLKNDIILMENKTDNLYGKIKIDQELIKHRLDSTYVHK